MDWPKGGWIFCRGTLLRARNCHSRPQLSFPPAIVIPAQAGIQACLPQQKPLDTDRKKSILIEDIVVDNPREGSMSVRTMGIPAYLAAVGLQIGGITLGRE